MERTFTIAAGEQISVFVEAGKLALLSFEGGKATMVEYDLPSDGGAAVERGTSACNPSEVVGIAPGRMGAMLIIKSDDGVTMHAGGIGGYVPGVTVEAGGFQGYIANIPGGV